MHYLVKVIGRLRDIPVVRTKPLEVGRDPNLALLLVYSKRHANYLCHWHLNWLDDSVN
jgi:hypothetical protein